jgi:hypothetical protein
MKDTRSFLMIRKFTLIILCAPLLSSCWNIGDKFYEVIECTQNSEMNSYAVKLKEFSCSTDRGVIPPLVIQKNYYPECLTDYPVPAGAPIDTLFLNVSYPDFQPVKKHDDGLHGNEISIGISVLCPSPNSEKEKSIKYATYIKNNIGYKDPSGDRQFAPIRHLGNNLYFQENIRKPHMDGNASIYFYKDEMNNITLLLLCDSTSRCEVHEATNDSKFGISYSFKGVPSTDFYQVNEKVKSFVSHMYDKELSSQFVKNQ